MTTQSYSEETIKALIEGRLSKGDLHTIRQAAKDPDRFDKYMSILQKRVPWRERILMRVGDHLFIVAKENGDIVTKCECGHEFGDYRVNWKLNALIFVRNTQDLLEEVYPSVISPDADWCELREYYCPQCSTQLCVESVLEGYPIIFDFLPDLGTFYQDWLQRTADFATEFKDRTGELLAEWKSTG
jgi:acetone carboxylase gamma subunit